MLKEATHRLGHDDLRLLVAGELGSSTATVELLRAAELSKHRILLAGLMRAAARSQQDEYPALEAAYLLLADVEACNVRAVRDVVAAPQFGSWAARCLTRLTEPGEAARADVPLWVDLGRLAVVAVVAAVRAGHRFALDIPLRHGEATFPGTGVARPGGGEAWEWGQARSADWGWEVSSPHGCVRLPPPGQDSGQPSSGWSPMPRIDVGPMGLRLGVSLDDRDPDLDCFGTARVTVTAEELVRWRATVADAWRILVRHHLSSAWVTSRVVRALVPLDEPVPGRSVSVTAAGAFGAIAMSLPADPLAMAEVFVHETQHGVLSAVNDLIALTGPGDERLTYAPWRDDPRPVGALLQGAFAHYGMARFWRQRQQLGRASQRIGASVEFARWRELTADAIGALHESGVLTEAGLTIVAAMRETLTAWQRERVPTVASERARDISLGHRIRWRLRHLAPDPAAIEALASAWLARARPGTEPAVALSAITAMIRVRPLAAIGPQPSVLGYLHRDRAGYATAASGYLRALAVAMDVDAWTGLAIARQHTGPAGIARILANWPEVVAGMHDCLRGQAEPPDPDALAAWLESLADHGHLAATAR